jgi:ATP-dependent Lon protease
MAPKKYPVMALRNTALFPHAVLPIGVGRTKSIRLMEDLLAAGKKDLVVVAQKDPEIDDPSPEDLYTIGTLGTILKVMNTSSGEESAYSYTLIIQGQRRKTLTNLTQENGYYEAECEDVNEIRTRDNKESALIRSLKDVAADVIDKSPEIPSESVQLIQNMDDPSQLTDFITSHASIDLEEAQAFLEETNINARLEKCIKMMTEQIEITEVSEQIRDRIREESDKMQKEHYLRQQLKAIQEQLGAYEDSDNLEDRIHDADMPEEAKEVAIKQYNRLKIMQPSSSEYSVITTYLETLLDIPWYIESIDDLDLNRAARILDEDHYGMQKVKDRIIEYLAVRALKQDMKGPILCFHGPPGVGKTSISKSIARTLGREFHRISLGGVHDESTIRGHRRTYVGAMPGRIVQGLIKVGTNNPVILLDEVDKIGRDFRGDPSAALLEVLDPEQNHNFNDGYVEIGLDLSNVLFIATANVLDTISAPLLDRMEIIDVPSYTIYEKQNIAKTYLIPKQIEEHGIKENHVSFSDEAVRYTIDKYTREAGVRTLDRRIADLCRKVAVEVAKQKPDNQGTVHVDVNVDYIKEVLGPQRYTSEVAQRTGRVGVATGLAWTQYGGAILFIEAQEMSGKGELKLTGQLGDVMKESVHAAMSYIRSQAEELGVEADINKKATDIHLHVPAGAIPKDGPSAGVAMFTAILSRLLNKPVREDLAMTGEITLSGNILPVGGVKEKVIAAHRAGIKIVVMPHLCEKDLVDIDAKVKKDIQFEFIETVDDLLPLIFKNEEKD